MKKTIMIKVEEGNDLAKIGVKKDLTGKFCPKPFEYVSIKEDGSVWFCCSSWLPYSIGNLYDNTLEEIWHGERAEIIRQSILDQSFSYCNHAVCGDISDNNLLTIEESFPTKKYPTHVIFENDRSCNLSCPSCRTEKIYDHEGEIYERKKQLHNKIINGLFQQPHNELIEIDLTGSGDPFGSKIFRDFLTTFDPTPWPNLVLDLQTNGVMFTPTNWKRIKKWQTKLRGVRLSFDAATSETYNITRRGGDWDTLIKNCYHLNEQIKNYPNIYVLTQFVVQDLNYKEMIPYAKLILEEFPNFYSVGFQLVIDWGTWDVETYNKRAVWKPDHPDYQEFLNVLKDPIFKNSKVSMMNVRNVYDWQLN